MTRLTLRTRALPQYFGGVFGAIKANSGAAFRDLIAYTIGFYRDQLFNPHWGEQIRFGVDNVLQVGMVFQGLKRRQAEEVWHPFLDWVAHRPQDFTFEMPVRIAALPARRFWDPGFLEQHAPEQIVADDRPGAPEGNFFWAGDQGQAGWFLHSYHST